VRYPLDAGLMIIGDDFGLIDRRLQLLIQQLSRRICSKSDLCATRSLIELHCFRPLAGLLKEKIARLASGMDQSVQIACCGNGQGYLVQVRSAIAKYREISALVFGQIGNEPVNASHWNNMEAADNLVHCRIAVKRAHL